MAVMEVKSHVITPLPLHYHLDPLEPLDHN
jgi:hypothetical protein